MNSNNLGVLFSLAAVVCLCGCPKKPPVSPPVTALPTPSPVEGIWESALRGEPPKRMQFQPGGTLQFQQGFEFFNPGQWDWDPVRKKLIIVLPNAPDDKLSIFQLYVGKGVRSFDPARKEISYDFDENTSNLNVAGWTYQKVIRADIHIPDEPTLR